MARAMMMSSSFLPGRGGIESYLAELCAAMAPDLAVLAAAEREGKRLSDLELPYPVHPFPGRLLMPGRAALRAALDAATKEGTDRILFGTPWPLVLLGPRLKAQGYRYAVVVHGAEMTVPAAVPGLRSRLARAFGQADLLLPVSDHTRQRLHSLVTSSGSPLPPTDLLRARVDLARFHPDVDTQEIRGRFGIPDGDRVLLCFGRLVPRKGVDRLLRALPAIRRAIPDVTVLIAGTGPEESRLRRIAKGVPRVVFAGRVPETDAPALYALADVFVLPVVDRWFGLEMEGLGVVLLEAAAAGTPAVTGRSGGTPEAVLDGDTGFVIDAREEAALVEAVVHLLQQPERAKAMGLAGREHVRRTFSTGSLPQALLRWLE